MPNTSGGTLFEEFVFERLIIPEGWINITPYVLLKTPKPSGQKYTHRQFTSQFKIKYKFDTRKVWSKNIEPDFVFYHPILNKVVALEVKSQGSGGSVDEKLQTGGKKLKRLRKLFGIALQIPPENVSYSYLLKRSDFDNDEYADTFEDIHDDGCEYYFVDDSFSFDISKI